MFDAISDTGTQDIGVFDVWTNDVHYLIHTWGVNEHEPRWSPDGGQIVYVVSVGGGPHDIWVMNADGSGQTQLTNNDLEEGLPSFTSDGKILFNRCVSGPRGCDIWIMNADGSGQRNLTDLDGWQGNQTASPSGNKIAFHSCGLAEGDWCQIIAMKSDGTGLTQLTHADTWVFSADWSPNGNQIAYVSAVNKGDIMIMKSNGDDVRNLTNTPDLVEGFPQWSPDGSKIVYTDNDSSAGSGHIWILDVNTGIRSMILSFAPPRDYALGYPDWQPVGK